MNSELDVEGIFQKFDFLYTKDCAPEMALASDYAARVRDQKDACMFCHGFDDMHYLSKLV